MESMNLLVVSISAFIYVFVVLSVIAIVMRLIIVVFPEKQRSDDAATFAAINSVFNTIYPGTKVTKIKELK